MHKLKISFFALGLVSGILAGYFFAQWQYRLGVPRAVSPCDQSATTTDCLKLLTQLESGTTPPPVYPETATTTPFAFGTLINIYEDKEFGFSLKYPDEMQIYPYDGCPLLNDKATDGGYFAIRVCNQKKDRDLHHHLARSLADYQSDYYLPEEDFESLKKGILGSDLPPFSDTTRMRIRIKKSDDVATLSGIKGLKQVYTIEYFDTKTGISIQERGGEMINHLRYVFYHPQKGAIAVSVLRPYPTLEDAIIQSVSY